MSFSEFFSFLGELLSFLFSSVSFDGTLLAFLLGFGLSSLRFGDLCFFVDVLFSGYSRWFVFRIVGRLVVSVRAVLLVALYPRRVFTVV